MNDSKKHLLPVISGATGLMRDLLRLRRSPRDEEFAAIVDNLEAYEARREQELEQTLQYNYAFWAERFELLKREFNAVWDFFDDIEQRIDGWYCVSPSLAPWKSVNFAREGYTFSACLMKNHHRDAPRSEKSITVSFGLEELPPGVGDERWIGRTGELTDMLAGLKNCGNKSLKEKAEGAQALKKRITTKDIYFRLNHVDLGQQSTRLPLSTLDEFSLVDLCQRLFVLLNNDVLTELQRTLNHPEQLLLDSDVIEMEALVVNK